MSTSNRHPKATPDDYGPVINIITWFLLVTTTLAVIVRIATKLAISRRTDADDYVTFVALFFSIAQVVAVSLQTAAGLGQHADTLSPLNLERFQQTGYAASLLYIATLCFSKISVALLLQTITPVQLHKQMTLAVGAVTVLWTVIAMFGLAFQCHLPYPWRFIDNACFNQTVFWNFVQAFNMLIDVALVLLPLFIVWRVQVGAGKKVVVFACFAIRIVVIAAVAAQLAFFNRATSSNDPTFTIWPMVICAQLVQSLSIVTACIPYLKPFLQSLESGMIRSDDLRRRGMNGTPQYGTAHSQRSVDHTQSKSSSKPARILQEKSLELNQISRGYVPPFKGQNSTTVTTAGKDGHEWDADSQTSQSKIIKQTTTWQVDTESQVVGAGHAR
ncbi:MAG: hypothetical protein Q9187_004904 [Circinaria calcarea]